MRQAKKLATESAMDGLSTASGSQDKRVALSYYSNGKAINHMEQQR